MTQSIPSSYQKPFLRGHFHQAAFFVAVGACAMLTTQCSSGRSFLSCMIYSLSLMCMLGISALYHRPKWNDRGRILMKRLDHAAIFGSIAGTGTPICLLALPPSVGYKLLAVMWIACGFGMVKSLFWIHSPKWVSAVLYIGTGWIYAYYLPELAAALTSMQLGLLLGGGIVYSLGAIVYALKRPNPAPHFLGYHEIFHAMVIVAAALHFVVIKELIV